MISKRDGGFRNLWSATSVIWMWNESCSLPQNTVLRNKAIAIAVNVCWIAGFLIAVTNGDSYLYEEKLEKNL